MFFCFEVVFVLCGEWIDVVKLWNEFVFDVYCGVFDEFVVVDGDGIGWC